MTTIELAKKELKFTIDDLEDLYDSYEDLSKNPLSIYPSSEKGYGIVMSVIFQQRWIEEIKNIDEYFSVIFNKIRNQIDLFLTEEEIQHFAIERTKFLQSQLQNNKWVDLINLKKFHLITNMFFIDEIHKKMFGLFDDRFHSFQNAYHPQQRSHKSLVEEYQRIVHEGFFNEFVDLLKILTEVKFLQILRKKLQKSDKEPSASNYYPLVFKNRDYYQLFHHCMEAYQENGITKTLLSKYFEFFKNDDFILEAVKKKNYFKFVQEELEIPMTRIEPYSSKDISERQEYESMKKSFFSE